MKILYVITKSNWGGAQTYVFDLATSLSENDDIVVVHGGEGKLVSKLNGEHIHTTKLENLDRDINFFEEIKVFKKLIDIFNHENPDIVHLNSSKIGGLGSLAGRIAGVPKIIFTAHGFAFNEDRPYWQKLLIKFLTYITILFSHKTIIVSKKELNQVKKWPLISKKVSLIYNGISDIKFLDKEDARKVLSEKSKVGQNKKEVIWAGTISELTKNKGLKYAIKGISKIKNKDNFAFIIIGGGEQEDYLKKIIKEKDLEDTVFMTGFVEDAQKYLKAFDVFLLSSVKEGLPYALLESGQAGNAIISTNVGGIKEIIDHEENGVLVEPKNKKDIAKALESYLENPNKATEFGERIQTKIKNKFNKEKMIKETKNLYDN